MDDLPQSLEGRMHRLDLDGNLFTVSSPHHGDVVCRFPPEQVHAVMRVLGRKVVVTGQPESDQDALVSWMVSRVEPILE